MPGPGSSAEYRSLSTPHQPPQPVWNRTASPGRSDRSPSAASASATVTTSPGASRSTPRTAATSSSSPRVTTCGSVSTPSRLVPPVLGDVGQPVPVVGPVAGLQGVEGVQVGTHLLGGGDLLDDPVDRVAARPSGPPQGCRRLTKCAF